jgi:hypothetical protein
MVKVFKKSSAAWSVGFSSTLAGSRAAVCGFLQNRVCDGIQPA